MVARNRLLAATGMAVLLAGVAVGLASAKGDPTAATISGPGLHQVIKVDDPQVLSLLNPWAGRFAEWGGEVPRAPEGIEDAYRVSVYAVRGQDRTELDLIYVFYYLPNESAGAGLVYVPGKGEDGYSVNVATIFAGRDGAWHPAARALDLALSPWINDPTLARRVEAPPAPSPTTARMTLGLLIALLAAAASLNRRRMAKPSSS